MSNENSVDARYENVKALVGDNILEKIKKSKILVVGAGGIGCEVLKNLVMTGFLDIEVIDLDTIDVSNLNRQFLFRKAHVGKSKALVASEMVSKFNPNSKVIGHHGDIKTSTFGASYFQKFTLAMNALDNISARMHVNRMCLSTNIPLIDGGTSGYLGQVQTILKGVTECYECKEKVTPKQPPVCTIRNNPSTIVHCVFWAKYLFGLLFGEKDAGNALNDGDGEENRIPNNPISLFQKYFHDDVVVLARLEDLWKHKPKPIPIDIHQEPQNNLFEKPEEAEWIESLNEHSIWSTTENVRCFLQRAQVLFDKYNNKSNPSKESPSYMTFDKDIPEIMDFVSAAANLRAQCFHITQKTRFQIKETAGNIIPAIATTNAIIAGLMVTEAIKVLREQSHQCKFIYCNRHATGKYLLQPIPLDKPNSKCYVCSSLVLELRIDTGIRTLGFLVQDILKKHLSLVDPMVTRIQGGGASILYEEGEDLDEEDIERFRGICARTLDSLNLTNMILKCESSSQNFKLEMSIVHRDEANLSEEEIEKGYELLSEGKTAEQNIVHESGQNQTSNDKNQKENGEEKEEVVIARTVSANKRKRAREETETESEPDKKKKHIEVIDLE